MEKTCEFCAAPRPIIYCEADGAFLCLSCDSKVHSANALSSRHTRTLLCDSCRYNQANVRCLDHLMLLCRGCDTRAHRLSPHHKKLVIAGFSGCPSAKNFAALWGFGVNELDDFSARSQNGVETSVDSEIAGVKSRSSASSLECSGSYVGGEHEGGSGGQYYKEPINNHKEQNNCLIMQQILDLKKLQLTEEHAQSPLLRRHDEPVTPSTTDTSGKLNEGLNPQLQGNHSPVNNPQTLEGSSKASKGERFTSSSQLDHLSGSSSVGDPFWPSKNPADPNQTWSQNIQDLGVCEEAGYSDVFNMPDVDLTFRDFEDFFSGDIGLTESLLGDNDLTWSEIEKETREDAFASSSVYVNDGEKSYQIQSHLSQSMKNSYCLIRSSGSPSFSPSRLSAESSGSECLDSGHSGSIIRREQLSKMTEVHGTEVEGEESSMGSSKERKKTRLHGKQTPLSPRKGKADTHKRIKSRCIKVEGYESDAANVTNSY